MIKQKQAFTLVELIVVITILAILGTIAFISLAGYSKSSRDSVRISDVSKMKTSLELFHIDAGKYPLPDNGSEVSYEGELLRTQGNFGETVRQTLSRNLNEIPTDPLSNIEYTYSTSNNRNEFQILNLLETELSLNTFNKANASETKRIAKIDGQYNGVFIKTLSYIVPVPSIINSEVSGGLILDSNNIKSQIVDGGDNMLGIGNISSQTGQLDINLSVYTGSLVSDDLDSKKAAVMTAIQGAYSGSILADIDIYEYILNITDESELAGLTDIIVLKNGASSLVSSGGNNTPNSTNRLVYNAVAYTGNGTSQDIETGIESYDINYDETRTYSKGSGNNTEYAFFRNNFTLLKFLGESPDSLISGPNIIPTSRTTTTNCATNAGTSYSGNRLTVTTSGCSGTTSKGIFATTIGKSYLIKGGDRNFSGTLHGSRILINGAERGNTLFKETIYETPVDYSDGIIFKANGNSLEIEIQSLPDNYTVQTFTYDNLAVYELNDWEEVTDDIVIPFKSSKVWVKGRDNNQNNGVYDTLRGVGAGILTNSTIAEFVNLNHISKFKLNGFTVGNNVLVNINNDSYIAWQQAYHKMKITTTSDNKRAIVAYDDVSKRSMTLYQGSGNTGHEIHHGLGVIPELVTIKNLDNGNDWVISGKVLGLDNYFHFKTNAVTNLSSYFPLNNSNNIVMGTINQSDNVDGYNYIAYSEANSDNIKIGKYVGDGSINNKIDTGFKPAYVMVKNMTTAINWAIFDNQTKTGGRYYADSSQAQVPGDYWDVFIDGFSFNATGGLWSTLNDEYLYIIYGDTNGDGGGSYADIPAGY